MDDPFSLNFVFPLLLIIRETNRMEQTFVFLLLLVGPSSHCRNKIDKYFGSLLKRADQSH